MAEPHAAGPFEERYMPALSGYIRTLEAELFAQIRRPSIPNEAEYDKRLARARAAAVGYVVAPDYEGRGAPDAIWLIVHEGGQLWRWAIVEAQFYDDACEEHEWLADVPQVFLTGASALQQTAQPIITYNTRRREPHEQELDTRTADGSR